jgi:hypothetical protein
MDLLIILDREEGHQVEMALKDHKDATEKTELPA